MPDREHDRTAIGRKLERAIDWTDRPLVSRRQIRYSLRNEERNGLADQLSQGTDGTLHDTEAKNLRQYDRPTDVPWYETNLFYKRKRERAKRSLIFTNLRTTTEAWRVLSRLYENVYIPNKQVRDRGEARTLAKLLRPLRKKEHQGQKLGIVHVDLVQALRTRESIERSIVPSSERLLPQGTGAIEGKQAEARDPPRGIALSRDILSVTSLHQSLPSTTLRIEDTARTHLKEEPLKVEPIWIVPTSHLASHVGLTRPMVGLLVLVVGILSSLAGSAHEVTIDESQRDEIEEGRRVQL